MEYDTISFTGCPQDPILPPFFTELISVTIISKHQSLDSVLSFIHFIVFPKAIEISYYD